MTTEAIKLDKLTDFEPLANRRPISELRPGDPTAHVDGVAAATPNATAAMDTAPGRRYEAVAAAHQGRHRQLRPQPVAVRASDGVRLACSDYGDRTACRTVVFLHGLCLSQRSWTHHIGYLLRRHSGALRVISYDHRGHGASQPAPAGTYRIEQLADDLAHVMAELDISGSVTFVGHSLGAMAALAYLARHSSARPVDPDSLVLVATAAGRLTERGLGRLLATPGISGLCRLVEHAPAQPIRALSAPVCAALGRWWGCGQTQRATLAALASAALLTTPASTALGFLPALRTFDAQPTLRSIRARTVVVSGSADLLTPPVHGRELAEQIPGAVHLCVPGAGHMLTQQAPHVVSSAIDQAIALASTDIPGGVITNRSRKLNREQRVVAVNPQWPCHTHPQHQHQEAHATLVLRHQSGPEIPDPATE